MQRIGPRWHRGMVVLVVLVIVLTGCGSPVSNSETILPATILSDPDSFIGHPEEILSAAEKSAAPISYPTPALPTPTRQRPEMLTRTYQVRPGDTLTGIAAATGLSVEMLMQVNGLSNADMLSAGQVLKITLEAQHQAPAESLIPDSELVYGPAFARFDVKSAIAALPGLLSSTVESFEYITRTGPELVELTALRYSIGPRVLLTLLEMESGYLSNPTPSATALMYPMGHQVSGYDGLGRQLAWAADNLNVGFYGWLEERSWSYPLADGSYVELPLDVNAGTVAIQRFLALSSPDYATLLQRLETFNATYRQLWGNPFSYAIEPLLPSTLQNPTLALPWSEKETWYLTGGPHGGWGSGSSWAAVDFVTGERYLGCAVSQQWVVAVADGAVIFSDQGMVFQDLDEDGFVGSGWALLYMHIASDGRVPAGTKLATGDPVGHPSCEGGFSDASHLHFARRYNGVWIAAEHPRWPLDLGGWTAGNGAAEYEGTLTRNGVTKAAAETWAEVNAITH